MISVTATIVTPTQTARIQWAFGVLNREAFSFLLLTLFSIRLFFLAIPTLTPSFKPLVFVALALFCIKGLLLFMLLFEPSGSPKPVLLRL